MGGRRDDLVSAYALLTRFPVRTDESAYRDPSRAVWAYPLVGATVGMVGAVVYALLWWASLPPLPCAIWAFGAMVLATGCLHEDGAADTADGFGGGRTRERKLEIMRDSRIGTYGVAALVLVFALRFAVLAALGAPLVVAAALVASAALSRTAMVALMWRLPAARPEGLSAGVGTPPDRQALEGLALGLLLTLLVLPVGSAVLACLAAAAAAIAIAAIADRQIGGQTGDVLGAAGIAAECAALTAIVAAA